MLELRQVDVYRWVVVEHSERGERIVARCIEWTKFADADIRGYSVRQRVEMKFEMEDGFDFSQPQRALPEPKVTAEIVAPRLRGGADREPLKLTHEEK